MTEIRTVLSHPSFEAARADLRRNHDRLVAELIELTEIPAPPFMEERRAEAMRAKMTAAGLDEVAIDAVGNVTGLRRGRGNGTAVVVAAHLDTVFPAGTDVTVRREGTRLLAPGIGDDTSGLAAMLAFVRALDAAAIETEHDILFVADVGEEGRGDLRGIRHLFAREDAARIVAFFTLDTPSMDEIVVTAVGSKRYHIVFRGPGGHSLMAFGTVNPMYALGAVIAKMAAIEVPREPRTTFCASVVGGGTSINAIPEEVWLDVDLRSTSADELARLDATLADLVAASVAAENARGSTANGVVTAEAVKIGDRPAGATAPDAAIVAASRAALTHFGFPARLGASSTDANIPMSLGVPAVKLGSGGRGGRIHTLEEWIELEPEETQRGLSAGLAAILAVAGLSG
ncbi:M20/M25/M40 family metallo-hydrolase [Acuticoccus sp. I52.16.1]|uniref:M20/M25/M40 family metallo-hydrolase n=1 Tax=Acuticoccus sp. I52.16.1 TaxID=2928472 RepID=UPI001FD55D8E|nr:M20/M25/M40 family metallo-hydrolase [Acuticoccus sp. I52.16.1]UOM33294.1 M20/M25/M40 family metallo-hydrolase [Acuticoccus sp. I52.16.1]